MVSKIFPIHLKRLTLIKADQKTYKFKIQQNQTELWQETTW